MLARSKNFSNLALIVPWVNPNNLEKFLDSWKIDDSLEYLILQQDKTKRGCALTKNAGITRAIEMGAETIIILDDDCYPDESCPTIEEFVEAHLKALQPQDLPMFELTTSPPARGTPYFNRSLRMPVAASMGFWTGIGDYDACGQLVHGATNPMEFFQRPVFGRYFPLCGMNLAFRAEWWPWCQFIDVPRFDDIWQGFLWQKKAYSKGHCFNLCGPLVRHARQSNVWKNLREEAVNLEKNEILWQQIAESDSLDYEVLRSIVLE